MNFVCLLMHICKDFSRKITTYNWGCKVCEFQLYWIKLNYFPKWLYYYNPSSSIWVLVDLCLCQHFILLNLYIFPMWWLSDIFLFWLLLWISQINEIKHLLLGSSYIRFLPLWNACLYIVSTFLGIFFCVIFRNFGGVYYR